MGIPSSIRNLCEQFLLIFPVGSEHHSIIRAVSEAENISYLKRLLDGQRLSLPTWRERLQRSHYGWFSWVTFIILVALTFPIPVLMIRSWLTRGTFNFLKSDGAVFLEKLDKLMADDKRESPVPSESSVPTSSAQQPESSHHLALTTLNRSPLMFTRGSGNDVVRSDLRQEQARSNLRPSSSVESIRSLSRMGSEAVKPYVYQEVHESSPEHQFHSQLSLRQSLCDRLQMATVIGALQCHTGNPVIRHWRIKPASEGEGLFFKIECGLRWTPAEVVQLEMQFPRSFGKIPPAFQPGQGQIRIPQAKWTEHLQGLVTFFQPNIQGLLASVAQVNGIFNKEDICLRAYRFARTDMERTHVLAVLINAYEDYREAMDRKSALELNSRFADCAERAERMIKTYLTQLPSNYARMVPEADNLEQALQQIMDMLVSNCSNEAWLQFEAISEPNLFLKRAFPHLDAMYLQLTAIFVLTGHKKIKCISETNTIEHIRHMFQGVCDLATPEQQEFLQNNVIVLLDSLIQKGVKAAAETPPEVALDFYWQDQQKLYRDGWYTYRQDPNLPWEEVSTVVVLANDQDPDLPQEEMSTAIVLGNGN